jgi:hypothetical protein
MVVGKAAEKVILIPWDPKSERHVDRMFRQRIDCGWKADEVPEWAKKQLEGEKFLYWMVN